MGRQPYLPKEVKVELSNGIYKEKIQAGWEKYMDSTLILWGAGSRSIKKKDSQEGFLLVSGNYIEKDWGGIHNCLLAMLKTWKK